MNTRHARHIRAGVLLAYQHGPTRWLVIPPGSALQRRAQIRTWAALTRRARTTPTP